MGLGSAVRRQTSVLWSDGRGPILLAVAGGWGLTMGVRMIYPVLLPSLRDAYGLDFTSAGLLVTVLFLAYALGQLPGGLLADRIGERRILAASMLVCAVTITMVLFAGTTVVLFVATALFGIGAALFAVARYTTLAALYPDHIGSANGATAAAQDASQSLLPPVAGFLAAAFAWQYGFGFAVPLFVLLSLALWLVVPASDDGGGGGLTLETARTVVGALRDRSVLMVTAIFTLGLCIWQAFTGFYPTYLIEQKGLSPGLASVLFGGFFVLGIAVKPVAGTAYDRVGLRRALLGLLVVAGSALAALPFVEGVVPIAALTVLTSFLLGFGVVSEAYLIVSLPEAVRGTGFGIIRTFAFGLGALSPVAFGVAADEGFFDWAFLGLAGLAGLMVLLVFWFPDEQIEGSV